MQNFARFLIIIGSVFVLVGAVFLVFPKLHLFRLPGDIIIKRENFVFVFPLATSIIISIIMTLIINLIIKR